MITTLMYTLKCRRKLKEKAKKHLLYVPIYDKSCHFEFGVYNQT